MNTLTTLHFSIFLFACWCCFISYWHACSLFPWKSFLYIYIYIYILNIKNFLLYCLLLCYIALLSKNFYFIVQGREIPIVHRVIKVNTLLTTWLFLCIAFAKISFCTSWWCWLGITIKLKWHRFRFTKGETLGWLSLWDYILN